MTGTFSVNESVAISRSRDKLRSLQLMSRKKLAYRVLVLQVNLQTLKI